MFQKKLVTKPQNHNCIPPKRKGIAQIIIIWIIYLFIISIFYIFNLITWQLYLIGASIMFILNTIFSHKICLLSILFLHNTNNCCKYCTINCWDYLMISSALIFCPIKTIPINILNALIITLSIIILIIWEIKFKKYPERFFPQTNHNLKCTNCTKNCKLKNK